MTVPMTVISILCLLALGLGIPVAASILLISAITSFFSPISFLGSLGPSAWNQSQSYLLVAIPFFILFGELLVRTGIAGNMYGAVNPWLSRFPGKLMQTNVVTCALFSATSGSSVATAATIGSVAIPEIQKSGYNERLFLGSIAAGGTLGILIPPSINLIIYGALTRTSVPDLYLAALLPGVLLAGSYCLIIFVCCVVRPDWDGASLTSSWYERLRGLPHLLPPIGLFGIVVGSIYGGIATPTEAAAVGVVAALFMAWLYGKLTWALFHEALVSTMLTTSMLLLIFIAASFLHFSLGFVGFIGFVQNAVENSGLGPYAFIVLVIIGYMILGCFLDGLSMTVLTVPILAPIVAGFGFDLVWFGIIVILSTEMGLITPPVGMNCYVVQGVRRRGVITDVFIGVLPFMIGIMGLIAMLLIYPEIALWLPAIMR